MFPVDGQRICSFTLFARDFDVDFNVTARLKRKVIVPSNPLLPATSLAVVATADAINAMQMPSQTLRHKIRSERAFYFVEIDLPAQTLQAIGVQIEVSDRCS
jgi:hypothetical protein